MACARGATNGLRGRCDPYRRPETRADPTRTTARLRLESVCAVLREASPRFRAREPPSGWVPGPSGRYYQRNCRDQQANPLRPALGLTGHDRRAMCESPQGHLAKRLVGSGLSRERPHQAALQSQSWYLVDMPPKHHVASAPAFIYVCPRNRSLGWLAVHWDSRSVEESYGNG